MRLRDLLRQPNPVKWRPHSRQKSYGSRFAVSALIGTLYDGRMDATGSFRNGRSVTLNWHKS
jgi:hypothetical protein